MRARIPEYWIVNLPARQVHVHREPADGNYTRIGIYAETETVTLTAHPDAQILVSDLLPPASV
jgi:Uma2 family endonuclease